MKGLCDSICGAIAVLPPACTVQEIEEALEPFFESSSSPHEEADGIVNDTGITPLVVACDKGNVACLEYLKRKIDSAGPSSWLSKCIGTPLGRSSEEGNTAMHHAAMAGCIPAISILGSLLGAPAALNLGSARNSHGDTPLMMAATSGHADFCRAWHELCIASRSADHDGKKITIKDLLEVWESTNDSNDSCLLLACGHGHVEVVDFLLSSDCGVLVDSDTLMQCQSLYQRMEMALRRNPSLLTQTHRDQAARVQLCVEKLQAQVARQAELAAQDLLRSENEVEPEPIGPKSKSTNKPRKKKKARSIARASPGLVITDAQSRDANEQSSNDEKGYTVQLTTLSDGTKAVRVEGSSSLAGHDPLVPLTTTTTTRAQQRSADVMFRERFEQSRNICSEVDSVMKALCLDMSMLLYTPHGMAIDLSPSQLDAVQDILKRQLQAVVEARAIQDRLHRTLTMTTTPHDDVDSSNRENLLENK